MGEKTFKTNIVMLNLDGDSVEMNNKSSESVTMEDGDTLKHDIHIVFYPVNKG